MVDRIYCQVDVQVRPVKVMGMRTLNVRYLPDGSVAKPREVVEREKNLSGVNEEPKPVSRDVGHLNA